MIISTDKKTNMQMATRSLALCGLFAVLFTSSVFSQVTITGSGFYIDGGDPSSSYTPASVNAQFTSPPNGTVVTSETFPVSQQICGSVTADGGSAENISIMLVLDVSGSMITGGSTGATRLEQLQTSVKKMLGDLDASKTKVGIVQFGHDGSGAVGSASLVSELTSDFSSLETAIDGMYAAGRTPTGEGMQIALSQLEKYSPVGSSKYQVVASDGYWNLGVDPTSVAAGAQTMGQTVHTVGISADHNVAKMQEIATAGGGEYFDATDINNLDNIFGSGGGFVGLDSALLNGVDITSDLNAFGQFCVDRDIHQGANDFLLEGFAGDAYDNDNLTIYGEQRNDQPPVPEPATILLLGVGALGLGARRLRRRK